MLLLKENIKRISLDAFFQICRALISVKCLFIGLSLLIVPGNYRSSTFNILFEWVDYRVWASIFIVLGLMVFFGIVFHNSLWRIGSALCGGILMGWAWVFIFAGAFTRSPPTFLVWISAALLDIFVAITITPKVLDNLLFEVERANRLTQEH